MVTRIPPLNAGSSRAPSPPRTAAATLVRFVLIGSAATGCSPHPTPTAPTATVANASATTGEGADASNTAATQEDAGVNEDEGTKPRSTAQCADWGEREAFRARASQAAQRAQGPCHNATSVFVERNGQSVSASLDMAVRKQRLHGGAIPNAFDVALRGPHVLAREIAEAIQEELDPDELACLAGELLTVPVRPLASDNFSEANQLTARIRERCGLIPGLLNVEIASNGQISAVTSRGDGASSSCAPTERQKRVLRSHRFPHGTPAALQCVEQALGDLKLSCLADHQLSLSYVMRGECYEH